jgi:chemotaxis protein CheD
MKNAREVARHKIYLHPAELVVATDPTEVVTVLGSCVSVTFHHPRTRMGAICHAVLPTGSGDPSRFVDQSVHYILDFFKQHQVKPRELVIKLFGGADMFSKFALNGRNRSVGAQNITLAIDTLREAGLHPNIMDIGGQQGRKLLYFTHTGEVFLKRVAKEKLNI